jgi:hypothetical protein
MIQLGKILRVLLELNKLCLKLHFAKSGQILPRLDKEVKSNDPNKAFTRLEEAIQYDCISPSGQSRRGNFCRYFDEAFN